MRDSFTNSLVELAIKDPAVLLLTGDHGYGLFDRFRAECPDQYINAGIAEQNMVGVAAGLARLGYRPFVYGLSAFVPIRVLEQIKLDVAHDNLPVVLIGDGAGFVYSFLGTSHQSTEDIACTRSIPNLSVFSPCDRYEVSACIDEMYHSAESCYIRIGKCDLGDVHASPVTNIRGAKMVRSGDVDANLVFVATGSMVTTAIRVANSKFPAAEVWSIPCLKPFDISTIKEIASRTEAFIVVLEEHSVLGGLGSIITEVFAEVLGIRILSIGVRDRFSEFCGSYDYLLKEHGLDDSSVGQQISDFLRRCKLAGEKC
ncbi:hypothetical protein N9P94_00135 [Pseudomonadales bacterium]|nr:hypothetical protein [Pseudomonadales bacterium]